ncbi:MAG: rhomboid family intramembrane serine protease [Caulobacteraceae bacterium]
MQGQVTFGRRGAAQGSPPPATAVPIKSAPDIAPPDEVPVSRAPFATVIILAFLALIFLLEMADKPMADPGVIGLASLVHFGAVSRDFGLQDGQVWRLLTAPWLHLNASHFAGNAVALVLIGLLLEPIIGWRWFAAVYTLGGIGGALGSIALNAHSTVSVGASGAILAVIGCAAAMSLHPASAERRFRIWRMCALTGLPALIPSSGPSHTDYSAHMGGAIVGFVIGFGLLVAWKRDRLRPPLEGLVATAGAVVGFMGVSAVAVAAVLPPSKAHVQVTAGLIPPEEFPSSEDESVKRSGELLASYPQDPRAHALAARMWAKAGADSEAEREVQTALASPLMHAPEIPADLEQDLRIMLLGEQLKQQETYAAQRTAESLCPSATSLDSRVQEALRRLKACE